MVVKVVPLKLEQEMWEKLNKQKGAKSWETFFLDNTDWDLIHTNLHAVRMIKGYKPSNFEIQVAKIIVNKYKDVCVECKEAETRLKNSSEAGAKKGIGAMFKEVLTGND